MAQHPVETVNWPPLSTGNILDLPPQTVELKAGCLLVAQPFLADPNFRRTVIFLAEHNNKGSFGLIINKPIPLKLSDAIENVPQFDGGLHLGGPVERSTLHFIHRIGTQLPGAVEVVDGVFWGGDFEAVKKMMGRGELSDTDIKLYIGYSGWGAGQLDDELKQRSWVVAPFDQKHLFEHEPNDLWRTVLRGLGGRFNIMAGFPEDPRLN